MDKVYYLDLQTLLEYLQGQSALLSTNVTVPGQKESYMGFLFFKNTAIIGCLVQVTDNTIWREGEAAYEFIKASTEWRVRMDPNLEQTYWLMKQPSVGQSRMTPPAAPTVYAPRSLMPLDYADLHPFTAKQRLVLRMVFALVNGERTPTHIKGQLRLPAETVDEALRSLHSLGVIE